MQKAVLSFNTDDLCDLGLLNPRFFLHNEFLEVLDTFDIDEEYITQTVRIRRKSDMPDEEEVREREAELLSRYNLDYFRVLARDETRKEFTALIKQRTTRVLAGILKELHLEAFPSIPTLIREDESIISFCADEDDLGRVLKILQNMNLPFNVKSLSRYVPPTTEWATGLTERQREILRLALESGYYEVPARISVTGLANVVGISKAAMSKNLRRAEGRVLRSLIYD